jgi:hypothetical protein
VIAWTQFGPNGGLLSLVNTTILGGIRQLGRHDL